MDIAITTKIETEDIMEALAHSQDDSFEFILNLDLMVGCWEFTERLRDHFVAECDRGDT